ncbi:hypothetical protein [Nostoc sp.]|uniref:hypothetical protein n=1 Tax=Nostoc sp. TaxID=1180 RepID=UPI002FFD0755
MAQSLWLFGTRLNIVADRTTTGGQHDLIEGYFPPRHTNTPPSPHALFRTTLRARRGVHGLGG